MQVRQAIPMSRYAAVSSRIKLIAGIDIAERRLPQDGRISTRAAGSDIEIRVSTVPAVHGESIVMRLLPKQRTDLSLEGLGMEPTQLASFKRWLDLPNGLVLVTGPTGAGKSTTLYAALAATNDRTRKIITVEDPVEYQLEHVVQVQAQPEIGYTFARALRAFLRHDPDVIMVGEIRDRETAEIAIQSALTGHLVLSTLHTNDAPSAVTRLIDMGIEPFLVAASLRAVMAQRLARRLCDHCASPSPAQSPDSRVWGSLVAGAALASTAQAETNARFRASSGCAKCQGTGFRGRLGIYSLLTIEQDIQRAILEGAPATRLGQIASAHGFRTLAQEGWLKVCQGVTTADEVVRAIGASD
jgi:general secretion pathway protein E